MSTLASVIEYGLFSALPAASIAGRIYFCSDSSGAHQGEVLRDNGASWDIMGYFGAAGASPITLISTSSPTGTGTVSFTSIPSTYKDLIVVVRGAAAASATFEEVDIQVNSDSGANYDQQSIIYQNTTFSGNSGAGQTKLFCGWLPGATAPANTGGHSEITIFDYADTTFQKSMQVRSALKTANSTSGTFEALVGGWWRNTAAINRVDVILAAGNFVSGTTVSLYGRS